MCTGWTGCRELQEHLCCVDTIASLVSGLVKWTRFGPLVPRHLWVSGWTVILVKHSDVATCDVWSVQTCCSTSGQGETVRVHVLRRTHFPATLEVRLAILLGSGQWKVGRRSESYLWAWSLHTLRGLWYTLLFHHDPGGHAWRWWFQRM